jgi:16S rRNA (cytosine967-C5)-methyltransferase
MSITSNQQRTFLRLVKQLRPRWRTDHALPRYIQSLLTGDRTFGSRDRRLYRELIYTTIRYLPWIDPLFDSQSDEAMRRVAWLAADTPATNAFRAAFATGAPPEGDKTELLPGWFREHCPEIFSGVELETQLRRAPLWLRLQTDADSAPRVFAEFKARGWEWRRSPTLDGALEVLTEVDVTQSDAWRAGDIEVQDIGSQLVLEMIGIEPGEKWLDACAGAGGKTLQLARLLGRGGSVDAHDIRPTALHELRLRAERAGMTVADAEPSGGSHREGTASTISLRTCISNESRYDAVLVDAPCSGSGTWRRAPHLKWTTTPALIADRAALQQQLLARFAPHVRAGGRLVYATCSLSSRENEDVVATFLAAHPDFQPTPFAQAFGTAPRGVGRMIFPSIHNSDGFFVASLRRK